jgi:hypothetical protein
MTRLSFLILLPLLAACTPPAGLVGVREVRVISAVEAARCTPLEVISTRPGLYGPVLGQQAVEFARNETLDAARDAGANAFVFDETPPGEMITIVRGTAYRC